MNSAEAHALAAELRKQNHIAYREPTASLLAAADILDAVAPLFDLPCPTCDGRGGGRHLRREYRDDQDRRCVTFSCPDCVDDQHRIAAIIKQLRPVPSDPGRTVRM